MTKRFTTCLILFSNETHFHLNEHVNTQNCRYWSETNPKHKHQLPLSSSKVAVWAALSAHNFADERGHRVTITLERYVEKLENFFVPKLQNLPGYNQRTGFQQDGATSHRCNRSPLPRVREFFPAN